MCCSTPRAATAIDVPKLVDTLPPEVLCQASRLLRHVADSAEMARADRDRPFALSELIRRSDEHRADCVGAQVVDALQFRGHLRDAHRLTALRAALAAADGHVQSDARAHGAAGDERAPSSTAFSRSRRGRR